MKQPHIQLDETVHATCALLPGDPARLNHIVEQLEAVQELAFNREFRSLKGFYKGMPVLAVSTGIGGSSAAIAIEELHAIGVDAMIRIGSCGALQSFINLGDLIFACGAIRDEGTSKAYVDIAYPAVPDNALLQHCIHIAREEKWPHHTGIVHSHESFYIDQNDAIEAGWSKLGVLGSDMESAALFAVGRLRHIATASILNNVVTYGQDTADAIAGYMDGAKACAQGERREIHVALEALYRFKGQAA
ncbi:MAG: nucleoside phosphorylase [Bulleidia sp.]